MKGRVKLAVGVAAVAALTAVGTVAMAGGGDSIRERLTGYEEDPLVLSTSGNGSFKAWIDERGQQRLPVLEPGQRAGGNADLSARAGKRERNARAD